MHYKSIKKNGIWEDGFLTKEEEKVVIEAEKIKQIGIIIDCFETAKAIRKQLLSKDFTIDELPLIEIVKILVDKRASHIIYAVEDAIIEKSKNKT